MQRVLAQAIALSLLTGAAQASLAEQADDGGTAARDASQHRFNQDIAAGVDLELDGLVALDAGLEGAPQYVGDEEEGDGASGCPGPSGCFADVSITRVLLSETDNLPGETRAALVSIHNHYGNVPAEDVVIRLAAQGNVNFEADGCDVVGSAGDLLCPVGTLESGQGLTKRVYLTHVPGDGLAQHLLVSVSSSTPDLIPGNNFQSHVLGNQNALSPIGRISRIDAQACPTLAADVALTSSSGPPLPGPVPGGGGFLELIDGGHWLGTPFVMDTGQMGTSVIFVLDNSRALATAHFDLYKLRIAEAASDWYQEALARGLPPPALAVIGSSDASADIQFSRTMADFLLALAAIEQRFEATRLFSQLRTATLVLSAQEGRTGVIPLLSSADAQGETELDPALHFRSAGVPIHPIVLAAELEPLARRIAHESNGFRRIATDGLQTQLADAVSMIKDASRLGWNAPSQGDQHREVRIRRFGSSHDFTVTSHYTQTGTPCGVSCLVTRQAPERIAVLADDNDHVVTLSIDPQGGILQFSLVEDIPSGWSVLQVSDGGFYDAENGQIRWDAKVAHGPIEFSYRLRLPQYLPPAPWGPRFFPLTGRISTGAMLFPTCGDSEFALQPRHPAQQTTLGGLYPSTVDPYEDTWRNAKPWISGYDLINVDHLTRAAQIVALNGGYTTTLDVVPWWSWLSAPPPYTVEASRITPALYTPGEPVHVELFVVPVAGTHAGAVEEVPPAGWLITAIGQDGVYDEISRTIRWGVFRDDQPRLLSYELLPPEDATGSVRFIGRYSVDGERLDIGGVAEVGAAAEDPIFNNGFEP